MMIFRKRGVAQQRRSSKSRRKTNPTGMLIPGTKHPQLERLLKEKQKEQEMSSRDVNSNRATLENARAEIGKLKGIPINKNTVARFSPPKLAAALAAFWEAEFFRRAATKGNDIIQRSYSNCRYKKLFTTVALKQDDFKENNLGCCKCSCINACCTQQLCYSSFLNSLRSSLLDRNYSIN